MIVTRIYLFYAEIVQAIFSARTPYLAPEPAWLEWDAYVAKYPTFRYQKRFGSPKFEELLSNPEMIRLFFIAGYYGKGPNGERPFDTEGPLLENWPKLIKSDVLTDDVKSSP